MYVKVHKEGNQWFRDDGTLVGKEIVRQSYYYKHLAVIFGKKIFIEDTNHIMVIINRGYFDSLGKFRCVHINKRPSKEIGFYAYLSK